MECAGCGKLPPLRDLVQPVQIPVWALFLSYFLEFLFNSPSLFSIVIFNLQGRGSVNVFLQLSEHSFPVTGIVSKTTGLDQLYTKNALDNN